MFLCPAEITEIKEMLLPAKSKLSVYFLYFVGTFCLSPAMFLCPAEQMEQREESHACMDYPES